MVQRESQQRLPSAQSGSQIQGGRLAFTAPEFTKEQPSELDNLIGSLVDVGSKLASTAWEKQKEEAYIEGVAQVNQVKSEAELESSPLTAAWTTAGYRDTSGRLQMAAQQSKISADMATLREKSPEEFQKYMAERRAELLPQMEGMSRQQRSAVFGEWLGVEQSASNTHTAERQKYIIETEQKSINAIMSQRQAELGRTLGDANLYKQSVGDFTSSLYANVWQNPKLTDDLRQSMTVEAAEFALSENHLRVFDALQNMEVTFTDGKTGKMFDRLGREDRVKLTNARRYADERMNVVQQYDWKRQIANVQAQLQIDPSKVTFNDIVKLEAIGEQNQWAFPTDLRKSFYIENSKAQQSTGAVQALMSGDRQYLRANAISDTDAIKAYRKTFAGLPDDQYGAQLLSIAQETGQPWAMKEYGSFMQAPLQEMMLNDEVSEANAATLNTFLKTRDEFKRLGKPALASSMLSELSDDQVQFVTALDRVKGGGSPTSIVQEAKRIVDQQRGAGPQLKAASAQANKEGTAKIMRMQSLDMMDTFGLGVKGVFSDSAAARLKIGVQDWWFDDSKQVEFAMNNLKVEVASEMNDVTARYPFMTGDEAYAKAVQQVADRTIETKQGPLTLAPGTNPHDVFKAPPVANEAQISEALSMLYEGEEDIFWTVSQGTVQGHVQLDSGERKTILNFPADAVGKKVQEVLARDLEEQSMLVGPGVERSGVQYNGENTAGAAPRVAFMLRDSLVQQEGVRTDAYTDGKGTSFGVGISSTGGFFQEPAGEDGKYTQAQISTSFAEASDHALRQGVKLSNWSGARSDAAVLLLSNVAYQNEQDAKELAAAIKTAKMRRSPAVAEAVLRNTAGFKAAGKDRQDWRLNQLKLVLGE